MFRCYFCSQSTAPYERKAIVPTEVRKRVYQFPDGRDETVGHEVVREAPSCPRCVGVATEMARQMAERAVEGGKLTGAKPRRREP